MALPARMGGCRPSAATEPHGRRAQLGCTVSIQGRLSPRRVLVSGSPTKAMAHLPWPCPIFSSSTCWSGAGGLGTCGRVGGAAEPRCFPPLRLLSVMHDLCPETGRLVVEATTGLGAELGDWAPHVPRKGLCPLLGALPCWSGGQSLDPGFGAASSPPAPLSQQRGLKSVSFCAVW